jgi:predicted lipase
MDAIRKKGYKAVSTTAATLESVAKPAITQTHLLMIEGQRQLYNGLTGALEEANRGSGRKANRVSARQFVTGLKKIARFFHRLSVAAIRANYWDNIQYVEAIERGLTSHQVKLESYFEQNDIDVHKNWAFSIENRQVINEISAYIRQEIGELKPIPIVRLWQYLIAWVVIQRAARKKLWCFTKDPEEPEAYRLEEMAYFSKFAVGVYGKLLVNIFLKSKFGDLFKKIPHEEILSTYAQIDKEEVLFSQSDSKQFLPVHAVCRDISRKSIVVCIRGTLSVFDCLTDLHAEYSMHVFTDSATGEELARGFVHKGIMQGALNLADALREPVREALEANPDYTLVIVGHSLGAGSAGLLALIWLSDPYFVSKGLRAYAYAPPPVYSDDFSQYLRPHVMSAVLGSDLVTRLSYGTIKDLVFIMRIFSEREQQRGILRASEIAASSVYGKGKDTTELIAIYHEIVPMLDTPKLILPGFIYQMYDTIRNFEAAFLKKDCRYVGEFADHSYYSQIVFAKTLLTDHMPDFYEKALKALVFHVEDT